MGRPGYTVDGGSVTVDGVDILSPPAWQRAQAGLFLIMQYPTEVPGVSVTDVLDAAMAARGQGSNGSLSAAIEAERASLEMDLSLIHI